MDISIYDSRGVLITKAEDYYLSWTDLEGNVEQDEEPVGKIAVGLNLNPSEDYTVKIIGTGEGSADIKALIETTDNTINIDYNDILVSDDFIAVFNPIIGDYNLKIDYNGDGIIDEMREPDLIEMEGIIQAIIDINPDTLNLKSKCR